MNRVLRRALTALSVVTASTVLAVAGPAGSASAFHDQCTNELPSGTVLQSGTGTVTYEIRTDGVYVRIGTIEAMVSPADVGVQVGGTAFAGIDVNGGAVGSDDYELAICAASDPVGGTLYVDVDNAPVGTGVVLSLFFCNANGHVCSELLRPTGVGLVTAAPLFSCVWVNGVPQIPGAGCPIL